MQDYKKLEEKTLNLIGQYCKSYPYMSHLKLAKLIIKENNSVKLDRVNSNNPEVIKRYISNYRNRNVKTEDFNFEEEEFTIPETLYIEPKKHYLPHQLTLVLCDIHIPFHDKLTLKLSLEEAKRRNVGNILLNGDVVDFYGLSRFSKEPRYRNIKTEIETAKEFFKLLRDKFPKANIFYKTGNHEDRYKHYFWNQSPELWGLADLSLDNVLGLNKFNIQFIDDKEVIIAGKLYILHGHEVLAGANTINIARTIRLKTNDNIMMGHFHRTQEDYQRTISDKIVGAWSVGCACGLSPLYMPINNWNNGFAFIEMESNGDFEVENKKIINGGVR